MATNDRKLTTLLDRVRTWPKTAQEEAEKALREIEEDFIIGPSTRAELDRAHQEALRGVSPVPRIAKAGRRIDAQREHLLDSSEAICQSPALRAVGRDPKLQPAAIGEFHDLGAGLRRPNGCFCQGHVGI